MTKFTAISNGTNLGMQKLSDQIKRMAREWSKSDQELDRVLRCHFSFNLPTTSCASRKPEVDGKHGIDGLFFNSRGTLRQWPDVRSREEI